MNKVTTKWLRDRVKIASKEIKRTGLKDINKLADKFKFENRKLSHPEECEPFYKLGKFCHDGKSSGKYCLLCSCSNYDASLKEGSCLIQNPCGKGYYYDRSVYSLRDVWDCSDCSYPHTRKETIKVLKLIKERVSQGDKLDDVIWEVFSGKSKQACAED